MNYNIFNRLSASRHTTIALKLSLQFVHRQDLHLVTTGSVLADPLLLLTHLNFSQFAHHFCEASINARAVLRLSLNPSTSLISSFVPCCCALVLLGMPLLCMNALPTMSHLSKFRLLLLQGAWAQVTAPSSFNAAFIFSIHTMHIDI